MTWRPGYLKERVYSAFRLWCPLLAVSALAGCGTYVPEIQENPVDQAGGQLLVKAIVNSVHCAVKNAVIEALGPKGVPQNLSQRQGAFMNNWGAQMALTLTVEEKSTLNPVSVLTPVSPPTAIFTLGLGAAASSDAIRKETLNFYYTVDQLRSGRLCPDPNNLEPYAPRDSLLLQNDLRVTEWLLDVIMAVGTREIGVPIDAKSILKQNVIAHEVKFEVVTSGNITPAWKLLRATVNQSGTFLSASRDRTHDLTITFGPIDPTQKNGGLIPIAENIHVISLFGLAAGSAAKSAVAQ
jgi:hypothetical protein